MSTAHSTLCTTAGSSAGPRPASARALTSATAGVRPTSTALSTVASPWSLLNPRDLLHAVQERSRSTRLSPQHADPPAPALGPMGRGQNTTPPLQIKDRKTA